MRAARRLQQAAVWMAAAAVSGAGAWTDRPAPAPPEIEARIARVISDLGPESGSPRADGASVSLAARMAHYQTPGVSIAVVNEGRLEWARGFGVREWGTDAPVTEATLFQAGSISKPIFALAVMRLVQERTIDLDEDVNRYLTSWKVPPNGAGQPRVTFRQILSHTAGLTVHGFPGYRRTAALPSLVDVLDGRPPANTPRVEVTLPPGTQFRYSGGGTSVGQQAIVDALGRPFPAVMRDLVLAPLGMTRSTFEQPLPERLEPEAATGHPYRYQAVDGRWHIYPEMAAAGLWTTPADLARAGIALQRAARGESAGLLMPAIALEMLAPQIQAGGAQLGLGFFLAGEGASARFMHGGWDEGFVAQMTMYTEAGVGAVIMLNSNQGQPLIAEIERAIAREYNWP